MMAVDGQNDRIGHEPGASELRPKEQLPVLETLFAEDSEPVEGAEERDPALLDEFNLPLPCY